MISILVTCLVREIWQPTNEAAMGIDRTFLLVSRACFDHVVAMKQLAGVFGRLMILGYGLSVGAAAEKEWTPLFNGKDLSGWQPKIAGFPLGENAHHTFRVEDGILKVSYADYPAFGKKFGHLYTDQSYSHFVLRLEYRFEGQKMADAPSYVNFNSGVMFHSQSAKSMTLHQTFPASLEFQFLADEGKGPRATGNVCTPGTHIEMDGKRVTQHIVESSAPTFAPGEWIKVEMEVHGHEQIIHRVNGKEVLRYQHPVLDPDCKISPAKVLLAEGAREKLGSGHIALQAEGHGVWFRNIEIKELPVTATTP